MSYLSRAIIADYGRLSSLPGVVSVSLGHKETGGHLSGRLCVKIYVRRKRRPGKLGGERLPRTTCLLVPSDRPRLWREIRVPTDVVEVRGLHKLAGNQFFNPSPSGAQLGADPSVSSEFATLTCAVRLAGQPGRHILTIGHLLRPDPGQIDPAIRVFQPRVATPSPQRLLGRTASGIVGNVAGIGYVDAVAVRIPDGGRNLTNASRLPAVIGVVNTFLTLDETLKQRPAVHKVGAITDETRADFSTFHENFTDPRTGEQFQRVLEFRTSPGVGPIAKPGDSGSLIVARAGPADGKAVGVLFGVDTSGERGYVVPFEHVARFFGAFFLPESS